MSVLSFFKEFLESSVSQPVVLDLNCCLRKRFRGYDCDRCKDSCKSQAIQIDSSGVTLAHDKCTNCMRCVASCPGGAFSSPNFHYAALFPNRKSYSILSCDRQKKLRSDELSIPCIGAIAPEMLLILAATRRSPLLINVAGCPECVNRSSYETFLALHEVLAPFLCHKIELLQAINEGHATEPPQSRRSYLHELKGAVYGAAASHLTDLDENGHFNPQQPTGTRWLPQKLAVLRSAFSTLGEKQRKELEPHITNLPQATDNCTLCPRCSGICPTGAVKVVRDKEGKKTMQINAALCTGCDLCTVFCKVKGIEVQKALAHNAH